MGSERDMPVDWDEYVFSDAVDVNPKRPLKRGKECPFIEMKSLQPNHRKVERISKREYKGGGSKFTKGDTLFARITPCLENGKTAFINELHSNQIGFGSTEFIILSGKEGITDNLFVYYLSKWDGIRDFAIKNMIGTSGRQRVPNSLFLQKIVCLPSLPEQQKIASILSALDDKIELNNEMNKTLEEMAQAIFKSWFVEFEFPNDEGQSYKSNGGEMVYSEELRKEIPKGWVVKPFSDIISVNPKRILKKGVFAKKVGMPDLNPWQSWIESWQIEEYNSGSKFQNGDILFARITPSLEHGKTALVTFLDNEEVAFGTTEFIVFAPKIIQSSLYIFCLARSETVRETAIGEMTGSSGRQRVPNDCFDHLSICVPSKPIIDEFNSIVSPFFEIISANTKESQDLAKIRDTLLPKLLSGEIRVQVNNNNVSDEE